MTEERNPTFAAGPPQWEELSEQDEQRRKESYERTLANLKRVLGNEDGFARLEAISDEEWEEARRLDDEGEAEGAA